MEQKETPMVVFEGPNAPEPEQQVQTPPRRSKPKRPKAGILALAAALAAILALGALLFLTGLIHLWLGRAIVYSGDSAGLLAQAALEALPPEAGGYKALHRTTAPSRGYVEYLLPGNSDQRVWISQGLMELEGGGTAFLDDLVSERFTVTSVRLSPDTLTLMAGQTQREEAELEPPDCFDQTLTWSSSAPGVAAVDAQGLITAAGYGDAVITAAGVSGVLGQVQIHVDVLPSSVEMQAPSAVAYIGQPLRLSAWAVPEYAVERELSWKSSDPAKATVEDGLVTGIAVGTVQITAFTENGMEAVCALEVQIAPTELILSQSSLELTQEDTYALVASVNPANATDKSVTWTSSDESVATVRDGVVTAIGAGTAVIKAETANGISAECTLSVLKKMEAPEIIKVSKSFKKGVLRITVVTNGSAASVQLYYVSEDRLVFTNYQPGVSAEDKTWTFNYPVGTHGGTHRFRVVAVNELGTDGSSFSFDAPPSM